MKHGAEFGCRFVDLRHHQEDGVESATPLRLCSKGVAIDSVHHITASIIVTGWVKE